MKWKNLAINILAIAVVTVAILVTAYALWCVETWVHWKFAYGPMVEERLERIEGRLEILESTYEKVEE